MSETSTLLERLRRHYVKPGPMPGGIFVPECGLNGGTGSRCDALYVGFTTTSGRILIGHELKVSRADWRHELDKPGKADRFADQCHAWYVVAPSTDIVPPVELPDGWGLMVPNPRTKTRMDIVAKAAVHRERIPAWDIVRSVMARVDTLQRQQIAEIQSTAMQDATTRLRAELRKEVDRQVESSRYDSDRALERFSEVFGMTLHAWLDSDDARVNPERLHDGLAFLRANDYVSGRVRGIRGAIESCERAAERLRAIEAAAAQYDDPDAAAALADTKEEG